MIIFAFRTLVHYSLHLLLPGFIAYKFYRQSWKHVWLILLSTMLVDLDHLFASPIFDPNRCSIGFHLLHSYPAILIYFIMLIPSKTRLVAIGLVLHMMTDFLDCGLFKLLQ
jgi:hypothetical protein